MNGTKQKLIDVLLTGGGATVGILCGMNIGKKSYDSQAEYLRKKIEYYEKNYALLNKWVSRKIDGENIGGYFKKHGFRTVAIYGMGNMGNRLYEELNKTDLDVKYAIDKSPADALTFSTIPIHSVNDELPEVDVIVVTPIHEYETIRDDLADRFSCSIISLEDVIYDA